MPRYESRDVRLVRAHCRHQGIRGKISCKRRGRDTLLVIESGSKPFRIDLRPSHGEKSLEDEMKESEAKFGQIYPFHSVLSSESDDLPIQDQEDMINDELETYIQDLKMGTLRIQDCLKEDDEIRQKAEIQLQKNVEDTLKGTSNLSTLTESHQFLSKKGLSQLWNREASFSAGQIIFLPIRLLAMTFRALLNLLLYPILFCITLGVIFSIPKK